MKKNLRSIIVVVICACLCVGYFFYLSQRNKGGEEKLTEVEMVITKDLEGSYPKSAREVAKFYNRILKCYYNEKYTEKQFQALTEQARTLMDEELKKQNAQEVYAISVSAEVDTYKKEEKTMSSYSVARSEEVEYKKMDGAEYAYIDVSYYIKEKDGGNRSNQTFVLRKDDAKNWKILGYYQ